MSKEITMKDLTLLVNFTRKGELGSFQHYFSHIMPDGKEVCLEACLEGYCVGIYDKEGGDLIGEKTCTKIEGMLESQIMPGFSIGTGEALPKAIKIANKKLKTQ